MARPAHPETVFHLRPLDGFTAAVLGHERNAPFVSRDFNGHVALEIGYHVSSRPRGGHVIARLGRDADLVLPAKHISQVHVAFEAHPTSRALLLCVRAQDVKTVVVGPRGLRSDGDFRQMVLVPGIMYEVAIGALSARPFCFAIIWSLDFASTSQAVHAGFQAAEARALNPCWLKTECHNDLEINSWYHTRLPSRESSAVQDVLFEREVDSGACGLVSKAIDLDSGHYVATKTVYPKNDMEMARLHREIKTLKTLKHVSSPPPLPVILSEPSAGVIFSPLKSHIIEFLGYSEQKSDPPAARGIVIFMPLRVGNLNSLLPLPQETEQPLVREIACQILSALDYLASLHLCHRDVKPANVLYYVKEGEYVSQLADFGFVNHQQQALSCCGTRAFLPPELHHGMGIYRQSPKMDVWSLFVTLSSMLKAANFDESRFATCPYADILVFVRYMAHNYLRGLEPMARENPEQRASAAQMLVLHFDGKGLATLRSDVEPIAPASTPAAAALSPPPGPAPRHIAGPFVGATQPAAPSMDWELDDEPHSGSNVPRQLPQPRPCASRGREENRCRVIKVYSPKSRQNA